MTEYSVTSPEELRQLCIKNNWFSCGTNKQYEKLFIANEECAPIEEIATIIWLCSDDCARKDILDTLEVTCREYNEKPLLTKSQFNEMTSGYEQMSKTDYIRQYCDNKYCNFELPLKCLDQIAFYDNQYYIDEERKIVVCDSFYIGD